MARAIWKGELQLGKHAVPVKFYSAAEDRTIHFHLLHAKDRAPVEQRIVRKDTGKEVAKEDIRKAFAASRETAVILRPEELQELTPPESREIHVCRFIPPQALGDQWYERPYYLAPDDDNSDYFALAEALAHKNVIGIVRWVMRKNAEFSRRLRNDHVRTRQHSCRPARRGSPAANGDEAGRRVRAPAGTPVPLLEGRQEARLRRSRPWL